MATSNPPVKLITLDQVRGEKLETLRLLEEKIHLQENLPHLHGWKLYQWAKEYWDDRNRIQLICAANQISKSSTQLRKHIHWATSPDLWPSLWKTKPRMFWYCYPTRDVAHVEWLTKILPEFMPRGEYKDHPQYGWKHEFYHNRIFAIHWNSGVSTFFKTYAQNVQDLQTGTVWKLDLDEEPPEELMGELMMRLAATEGYMSAVFTPTLGQAYWQEAIEGTGQAERFKGAFKRQISMYDCLKYADGTNSPWSEEQINRAINSCKSPQEVERRVMGRFVVAEGLKYPSFHKLRNRKPGHPVPKTWSNWCGVDPGSGGDNHPAAIAIVAVSPDWKQGRVWKGWRGDGVETTAGDVVKKCIEMVKGLLNVRIMYDWASRDFYSIAREMGLQVEPAEKNHLIGEQILNVLFKNQMLWVYDYPELDPLCTEFSNLKNATQKNKAKDDYVDATRYAVSKIPWDWSAIKTDLEIVNPEIKLNGAQREVRDRRQFWDGDKETSLMAVDQELEMWNHMLNPDYDEMG